MQIENFFNLVDKELAELLKTQEVQVVIEPIIIDHGEKEFDIDDCWTKNLLIKKKFFCFVRNFG